MKLVTLISQYENPDALRHSVYVDHYARLDASGLLQKWKEVFAKEHDQFLRALSGETGDVLVVATDGVVLGYLVFEEYATISGASATIIAFRVIPEYRGMGYGRKLLAELMSLARQTHWERVTVDVGVGATPAINLYASVGFEATSTIMEVIPNRQRSEGHDRSRASKYG